MHGFVAELRPHDALVVRVLGAVHKRAQQAMEQG